MNHPPAHVMQALIDDTAGLDTVPVLTLASFFFFFFDEEKETTESN